MHLEGIENTEASYATNQFFAELNIPTAYRIRISVVKGPIVNAFALPGGRIVIYDALLNEIEDYSELAALLSHEFIHVNNKHSTKAIFRKLGSRIFVALLLGKIGAVSSILVDQADNLKSLNYSRKLEKEADLDGVALLMERKIDPRGFSELLRHLERSAQGNNIPELLASHPDTERRIDYITEESRGATIEYNEQLKTIFNKIKQTLQQ
jgi:predicted Zn-dependent protease